MIKAKFVERKNRFTALVEVDGQTEAAHVANSGRLKELFVPGGTVYLVKQDAAHRLTKYDLALVEHNGLLVSVDARVPNEVVSRAIDKGELAEFKGCRVLRREVRFGESRLDILAANSSDEKIYVEVKSCTLVEAGTARFPDAPTERGARHLMELARAVSEGYRAAVVFLIQRDDAVKFAPNDRTDPEFGRVLREVYACGVEVYAYICRVTPDHIRIVQPVPVCFNK